MKKEKVFIVISHKHNLKPRTKDEWEVSEAIEFVSQLRNRHITMSSAVGDYINRTMVSGARSGMTDYEKFETYVRSKYEKQMTELDNAYGKDRKSAPEVSPVITDEFGNTRAPTVFDKVA